MARIRFKRGTRAQLNTAAGASLLAQGEPYLISDESRIAVGAAADAYKAMMREDDPVVASQIHAATSKAAPVDADELGLVDSAASWGLKKITWANLKATLLTFVAAGTGAVTRTLQNKAREWVSVKDFGGVGDGMADDRAAIVATQAIGKGIVFPAGVYRIASNLTISGPIIFCPGATIKPDAGVVVTIAGPVSADEFKIFDATLGSFSLTVRRAKLSWFGVSSAATAADNTTAFNAAHSACPSDGIELHFPSGQIHSNSFVVTKGGVILVGHRTTTWLVNNTTNKPCVDIDGASPIYWNEVHRLRIAQASGVTPVAGNCGVRMRNTSTTKITEISCFNYPAPLYEGFVFKGASMNHLDTLYATGCLSNAYRWEELSGANCVDNEARGLVAIANLGTGFIFSGCEGFYGYNLNAYDNAVGVRFTSGSYTNKNIFLESCVADMSESFNWLVEKLHSSVFTNIWGSTQKSAAVNTFASGLYISSADCYDIGVTNSQFFYNNSHGVVLTGGATNIRFTGCLFGGSQGNGRSGAGSGLYLELCSDVVVTGCRSRGNASNGVNIATTASSYILVTACNLRGNTGASLVNTSTGAGHSTTGNIT